jgi:hypothetical protein
MLGHKSLNLELLPLDPDLEKVFRRKRRAPVERKSVEMGDNMNMEQPRGENEQLRARNVDYTRSLRDLFAPVATISASCIVLTSTNATHFELMPHVIQLLHSFYGLDNENPYNHVKKFKDICATSKFQITSRRNRFTLNYFLSLFRTEPRHGWTQTCPSLLHLVKTC